MLVRGEHCDADFDLHQDFVHALWHVLPDFQLCLIVYAGPGGILAGAEKLALTTALAGFVVLGSQVHRVLTCFPQSWAEAGVGEDRGGGGGGVLHCTTLIVAPW